MTPVFEERIKKIQGMMAECNLDVLFVNNRENLIYLTGLTQIECLAVLIPRNGEACAVTLWLEAAYAQQGSGITTYGYHFPRESLADKCIERMKVFGYATPRVGFERYFVAFGVYDALRKVFLEENFVNAGDLFYRLRSVKDPQEIELMRHAGRIVDIGMTAAINATKANVKEVEILAEAEYAMLKAGSSGSPFRPQVVSGEHTMLTHPCAGAKTIASGEIVVIHIGAAYQGYCAKLCRTIAVGDVASRYHETHKLLLTAQNAAMDALRPGATSAEVDSAARSVISAAGLEKYYLDDVGHGVGIRQSEFYPILGKGRLDVIEAGMVVALSPMIHRPDCGGPRITDCIYVGPDENQVMTRFPRKLFQV